MCVFFSLDKYCKSVFTTKKKKLKCKNKKTINFEIYLKIPRTLIEY